MYSLRPSSVTLSVAPAQWQHRQRSTCTPCTHHLRCSRRHLSNSSIKSQTHLVQCNASGVPFTKQHAFAWLIHLSTCFLSSYINHTCTRAHLFKHTNMHIHMRTHVHECSLMHARTHTQTSPRAWRMATANCYIRPCQGVLVIDPQVIKEYSLHAHASEYKNLYNAKLSQIIKMHSLHNEHVIGM